MARLFVDFEANAAYLEVSGNVVVETCEAAPGVLIDLDEFGCAVGIEVLSLSLKIPVSAIERDYHVRPSDLEVLKQIRPDVTSFVARQSMAPVQTYQAGMSVLT